MPRSRVPSKRRVSFDNSVELPRARPPSDACARVRDLALCAARDARVVASLAACFGTSSYRFAPEELRASATIPMSATTAAPATPMARSQELFASTANSPIHKRTSRRPCRRSASWSAAPLVCGAHRSTAFLRDFHSTLVTKPLATTAAAEEPPHTVKISAPGVTGFRRHATPTAPTHCGVAASGMNSARGRCQPGGTHRRRATVQCRRHRWPARPSHGASGCPSTRRRHRGCR